MNLHLKHYLSPDSLILLLHWYSHQTTNWPNDEDAWMIKWYPATVIHYQMA